MRGRFLAILIAIAISLPVTSAPAVGAPADFHSQWLGQSPYPTLASGTAASYTVTFRNTGTATWRRGDPANQVNLGIAGDSRVFFDLGMAVTWLSPDRIATTTEESVAPGGTGTFSFMVRAPLTPGVYRVPLRLVVEGVTWLEDEGVHFVLVSEPGGFSARWMAQTPWPTLSPGETATVSVTFRNMGSRAFVRGTAGQQLNLGVAFDDPAWGPHGVGWLSPNRPATTNEAAVPPGATASFTFVVRAPGPGRHVLRLRPVVEGVAWLEDEGVHVVITVAGSAVLVGAGDIATCAGTADEATGALLDGIPGAVATFGDNAYESGTPEEFLACYEPSWGRHRARTRPAIGNHEYGTLGGAGHFEYFGSAAGERGRGYYSYDLGSWHVIVLNSNCGAVGGCGIGSAQEHWLRMDLAASSARCTVAYWHHPRFSSGPHGSALDMDAFWRALYAAGAELVLVGHDHHYERFAPQDPNGVADSARGIRQFIVGTGGAFLRRVQARLTNSEVVRDDTHGVLKLSLHPDRFDWEFVPIQGQVFTDRGSGACH